MNSFKQWALDLGLWEAKTVATWRWTAFRLRFWDTPTNLTHSTYLQVIEQVTTLMAQQVKASYVQGLKDGSLQTIEALRLTEAPTSYRDPYIN